MRKNNYYYGTTYLYDGDRLVREKTSIDEIWYLYDQNGMTGFQLNGSNYTYVRNLAGDVVKVIGRETGTVYASYTYDAWGKCTIGTNLNNIATRNPIRYRGYYYDSETGFYYLNSRYYDPETGRFISPDVLVQDGSLYTYCGNDPINRSDANGMAWQDVVDFLEKSAKVVVGGIIAVTSVAVTIATAPLALIPGATIIPQTLLTLTTYGGAMVASSFDNQILTDMQRIKWNPFNIDASATLRSDKISFYKGSSVFRINMGASAGYGGMMFISKNAIANVAGESHLRHEYGHVLQGRALGLPLFTAMVAIPSAISISVDPHIHHTRWFEIWATNWGR